MTQRKPDYWEQVQQEIRAICREQNIADGSLTWQSEMWDTVLDEAVMRLYVKGRYQIAPF